MASLPRQSTDPRRRETAAWLMGLGALVEVVGVVLLLSGAHDVGELLRHAARAGHGPVAATEGTVLMLLVVLGVAATLVWLGLAGAVASGAGWAPWLATGYAVLCLGLTGLGVTQMRPAAAWLGVAEACVAVAVLLVLWTPLRRPRR